MKIQRFGVLAFLALALVTAGCQQATSSEAAKSSAKAITALSFTTAANPSLKTDYTAEWNDVSKRFNIGPLYNTSNAVVTDLTGLVATFTLSAKASAKVETVAQVSGTTANDFTSDVTYTVTAEDGSTATYPVHVVLLSDKDISAYSLAVGSDTYTGTITTTEPYTISLAVPHGTDVSALVATFTIPEGASAKVGTTAQVSGTTANDFSSQVVYTVTAQDLSTAEYTVTVTVLPEEKLLISEYFEGTSYNKYIEVSNVGSDEIDLSAYTLNLWNYNSSNVKNATSDVAYALTGTLAAGASHVYYYGTSATLLDTVLALSNATVAASLANFNGNDPMVLKHSGVIVDQIGLDDGAVFGLDTKLVRRAGKTATRSYSTADWHVFPVSGATLEDDTAGTHTGTEPAAAQAITEFLLTTSGGNVRGTITQTSSGGTIAVTAPAGTVVTALKASVMTSSNSVTAAGALFTDQSTAVDYSSPVTFVVTGTDGSTLTYTVTVTVPSVDFVALDDTHNYSFDGGIAQARTYINGGSADVTDSSSGGTTVYALADGTVWSSASTAVPITGIITGYTSTNLYLQDQNGAICVYQSSIQTNVITNGGAKIGDKITITNATGGTNYYGLLEISKFGTGTTTVTFTIDDATNTTLYYVPVGSYTWQSDRSLKLVRYDGTVAVAPTSTLSYRGSFDTGVTTINASSTALFRTLSTLTGSLTAGTAKSFYGVLDVYRAKEWSGTAVTSTYFVGNYLLISSAAQIQ